MIGIHHLFCLENSQNLVAKPPFHCVQEFWSQELDRIQNKVLVSTLWCLGLKWEELKTGVNPEGLELSDVYSYRYICCWTIRTGRLVLPIGVTYTWLLHVSCFPHGIVTYTQHNYFNIKLHHASYYPSTMLDCIQGSRSIPAEIQEEGHTLYLLMKGISRNLEEEMS